MDMATPRLRSGLLLCLLTAISSVDSAAIGQSKPSRDRVQQIDRMIDAMASRNKPPRMVHAGEDIQSLLVPSGPYDWSEQKRVNKAVEAVRGDTSDEMWWRLYQHTKDNRYVMTLIFDGALDSKHVSVSDICEAIVEKDLEEVYVPHLPKVSGSIYLSPTFDKKLAGGPLYEVQIAVCENAMKTMATLQSTEPVRGNDYRADEASHTFTQEEKAAFTRAMKEQISVLKRTKQAIRAKGPLGICTSAWEPLEDHSGKNVGKRDDKAEGRRGER
jgi:hypothetical protein